MKRGTSAATGPAKKRIALRRAKARVVAEGNRLRVDVAGVDELGADDDYVVGDQLGIRAGRVQRRQIATLG